MDVDPVFCQAYKDYIMQSADVIKRKLPRKQELMELVQVDIEYRLECCKRRFKVQRVARGKGYCPPASSCDESEQEESEQEEDEAPPMKLGFKRHVKELGKGVAHGKYMSGLLAGDFKPAPKKNDKELKVEQMLVQVTDMMRVYNTPGSLITLSRAQFLKTLEAIRHNIRFIPLDTPHSELMRLKNHVFRPPAEYTVRLPVQTRNDLPYKGRGKDVRCKACDERIDGRFVPNLTCARTKMHPACAAVVVCAVGKEHFYNCMSRMSSRQDDGSTRTQFVDCRHPNWKTERELHELIEEAREMFLAE